MVQGSCNTACDTGECGGRGVEDVADSVVDGGGGGLSFFFGKGPLGAGGGTNGGIKGPDEAGQGMGLPPDWMYLTEELAIGCTNDVATGVEANDILTELANSRPIQ